MTTNWDDPEDRLRHIERVGVDRYGADLREHQRKSVIKTVNGYDIRTMNTRFGQLYLVAGLGVAFAKLWEAEDAAKKHKPPVTP
jgi:hypothetical protein